MLIVIRLLVPQKLLVIPRLLVQELPGLAFSKV
nr:MAG TPA: hypothetical protein [Caudoviricetes sp.]